MFNHNTNDFHIQNEKREPNRKKINTRNRIVFEIEWYLRAVQPIAKQTKPNTA